MYFLLKKKNLYYSSRFTSTFSTAYMNTQGASTSSLSSSSKPWWKYDVFLSFRDVGTHRSFADNLYAALTQKGILTVHEGEEFEGILTVREGEEFEGGSEGDSEDEEFEGDSEDDEEFEGDSEGEEFERDNLLNTIYKSRFTIIILSRNYAASTWWLDKLEMIVRSTNHTEMTILPIFYDVDQSDVEEQTGSFAQAFTEHKELFEKNIELWRAALRKVANLFGWSLKDR